MIAVFALSALALAAEPQSSRPPRATIPPTEIDGVYTGTYGSNPDDKVTAKLYVKFIDKGYGGGSGALTGLFTLDIPPSLGAKPVTYTYKLSGGYNGILDLGHAQPLGKPAPNVYAIKSLTLAFAKGPLFKNAYGQLAASANPDKISTLLNRYNPSRNTFEAIRDKAESANLDSLMAAVASAAGPVVSTTAPAAAPAIAPGGRVVRPTIVGVFNGTYTRANESPTKFKLTITRRPYGGDVTGVISLAGEATIYLSTDSGTKAYTYSLQGSQVSWGQREFNLKVQDWDTIPPKDFKNFKGMGFNGLFRSNVNQNTARIVSKQASGALASFFIPKFEATWDATESQNIRGTLAAQKAVDAADQAAATKAQAEIMKNAKPKELASKDLVRKSRKYWDGYETDMIREVFDGGFGAAIDENEEFQKVFCTYVEMLSAKFPDCLPANHVRVTNIRRTNRKFGDNGMLISEENHDYTVDMDPRFVEGYKQCYASLNSKGAEIGGVIAAVQPGGAYLILHDLMAVATGMQKFFADHGGKSAAARQMNENFLRAINDKPSLQQSGGKIDGAQAESDKDLPPGRFARLVDAANAFDRERAKADPIRYGHSASHDTAFNQRLAELEEAVMSPQEEYYYANDFEARFFDQIMQSRANCTDPAWPQLHPAVEKAIAEIK